MQYFCEGVSTVTMMMAVLLVERASYYKLDEAI